MTGALGFFGNTLLKACHAGRVHDRVSLEERRFGVVGESRCVQGDTVQNAAGAENEDVLGLGAFEDFLDQFGQLLQRFDLGRVEWVW